MRYDRSTAMANLNLLALNSTDALIGSARNDPAVFASYFLECSHQVKIGPKLLGVTELLKMSTSPAYNIILEETTRIQIVVSDIEARLATKELNPGSRSSDKKNNNWWINYFKDMQDQSILILQWITMSRVFNFVLALY